MSIHAVDHIQITAGDGHEPLSRQFYGNLLGLKEIRNAALDRAGIVRFSLGDVRLDIAHGDKPASGTHLALRTSNLNHLLERLQKIGIRPDVNSTGKSVRAYLRDPHGNLLELIESPVSDT